MAFLTVLRAFCRRLVSLPSCGCKWQSGNSEVSDHLSARRGPCLPSVEHTTSVKRPKAKLRQEFCLYASVYNSVRTKGKPFVPFLFFLWGSLENSFLALISDSPLWSLIVTHASSSARAMPAGCAGSFAGFQSLMLRFIQRPQRLGDEIVV